MMTRRTAALLLSSAALGLAATSAGPAAAHSGDRQSAHGDRDRPAAAKARAHRAQMRSFRRAVRNCSLSGSELLTAEDNALLARVQKRLAERVDDDRITTEQAARRFARIQKRVTIRVAMREARRAPVLKLFGVSSPSELRTAIAEAGGLRPLIDATDGVTRADFRTARRQGIRAGRAAVIALCAEDEAPAQEPST